MEPSSSSCPKPRLLIVDDERDLAETLAHVLARRYDVDVAFDGRQALAMLETASYDAAVIDLVMPILDGEATILEMRARRIEVPVIVSSGTPELGVIAARLHAVEVLPKPYELSALHAAIERVTRGV